MLTGSEIGKRILQLVDNEDLFLIISIVTKAEVISISIQRAWGENKIYKLKHILKETVVIPIDIDQIVDIYAGMDAFSQENTKQKNWKCLQEIWIKTTCGLQQLHNLPALNF